MSEIYFSSTELCAVCVLITDNMPQHATTLLLRSSQVWTMNRPCSWRAGLAIFPAPHLHRSRTSCCQSPRLRGKFFAGSCKRVEPANKASRNMAAISSHVYSIVRNLPSNFSNLHQRDKTATVASAAIMLWLATGADNMPFKKLCISSCPHIRNLTYLLTCLQVATQLQSSIREISQSYLESTTGIVNSCKVKAFASILS